MFSITPTTGVTRVCRDSECGQAARAIRRVDQSSFQISSATPEHKMHLVPRAARGPLDDNIGDTQPLLRLLNQETTGPLKQWDPPLRQARREVTKIVRVVFHDGVIFQCPTTLRRKRQRRDRFTPSRAKIEETQRATRMMRGHAKKLRGTKRARRRGGESS